MYMYVMFYVWIQGYVGEGQPLGFCLSTVGSKDWIQVARLVKQALLFPEPSC